MQLPQDASLDPGKYRSGEAPEGSGATVWGGLLAATATAAAAAGAVELVRYLVNHLRLKGEA
jgi:hypothetical protein